MAGTFLLHEIGRTDGRKVFQNSGNVFQIGRNKFYDKKNEILIKIPVGKRSQIGLIVEFCRIPSGFPNQAYKCNGQGEGEAPI
jgi:hypothetical protein